MRIPFLKMHGAANDFVVVDHRRAFLSEPIAPLVARLCDRRRGIGADGLLLLESDPEQDFAMRYFNADGGEADYCGNGTRCLARFALDRGIGRDGRVRLQTAVGAQQAERAGDAIRVHFGRIEAAGERLRLEACGRGFEGRFVRAGVPHFVVGEPALEAAPVDAWGRALRGHAQFGREGANVDFVTPRDGAVAMRTYERGVEGETLACGSGAIATALWAIAEGHASPVRVRTAGGDELVVTCVQDPAGYDVTLTGPAEVAFEGIWREDGVLDAARGGSR